jgi:hypothetical protein
VDGPGRLGGFLRTPGLLGRGTGFGGGARRPGLAGLGRNDVLVREHRLHFRQGALQGVYRLGDFSHRAFEVGFERVGLLGRFDDFLEFIKIEGHGVPEGSKGTAQK